jgi:hypothetical protein
MMLKIISLVFYINLFLFGFSNDSTKHKNMTKYDYCAILDTILYHKYPTELLCLNDTTLSWVHVRVIDLTKRFKNCGGFLKVNNKTIPYLVVHEIPIDANVGAYRDIFITYFKKTNTNKYNTSISAFQYASRGPSKTESRLDLEIQEIATNKFIIIDKDYHRY